MISGKAKTEEAYTVETFIEIPKGTQNKYEYNAERGLFFLDRVLYSPVHYPADYGFIPGTLAEDGDPLDILVLISNPTFPGCLVPARVIGMLSMVDDKGIDTKILSVAAVDPRFAGLNSYRDLPPHLTREIEYFFRSYKELEEKCSHVGRWEEADQAMKVVTKARKNFKNRSN